MAQPIKDRFTLALAQLNPVAGDIAGNVERARGARARAFMEGRGFTTPHDVKSVGLEILRHRVIPTYEAEAEGVSSEDVIRDVFDTVPVP